MNEPQVDVATVLSWAVAEDIPMSKTERLRALIGDGPIYECPTEEDEELSEKESRDAGRRARMEACGHFGHRLIARNGDVKPFPRWCERWREGCKTCLDRRINGDNGFKSRVYRALETDPDTKYLYTTAGNAEEIMKGIRGENYFRIPCADGQILLITSSCCNIGQPITQEWVDTQDWKNIAMTPGNGRISGKLGHKLSIVGTTSDDSIKVVTYGYTTKDLSREDASLAMEAAINETMTTELYTEEELLNAIKTRSDKMYSNLRELGAKSIITDRFTESLNINRIDWTESIRFKIDGNSTICEKFAARKQILDRERFIKQFGDATGK